MSTPATRPAAVPATEALIKQVNDELGGPGACTLPEDKDMVSHHDYSIYCATHKPSLEASDLWCGVTLFSPALFWRGLCIRADLEARMTKNATNFLRSVRGVGWRGQVLVSDVDVVM
jgi:hypothetical protein